MTPEQYCANNKIKERAYYYRLEKENSNLRLVVSNGKQYVMDLEEIEKIKAEPKTLKLFINGIISDFNQKIYKIVMLERTENKEPADIEKDSIIAMNLKKEIIKEAEQWNLKGVPVRGYTSGKLYNKIRTVANNNFELNPEPLRRAERCDKHVRYYNEQLQKPEVRDKAIMLAAYFFFKNAQPKMRALAVTMQEYSKKAIDFVEIATIPRSTLVEFLNRKFDSLALKLKHEQANNYTKFISRLAYNEGAFTNDIKFMQWWCIDDHVEEVAAVLVWNELEKKWEPKKVYHWAIMDAFTFEVIAYMLKPEPFTAQDIKTLLIQALMSRGRPSKGILMDNGLAASKLCAEFLTYLQINFDPGPAYAPLHKAVLERSWRFRKDEFNATKKNYIGGGRKEVRHTTKKLSPEPTDYTFEQYLADYDTYMNGWYRNKPREREINFVKREISIKDHFEECWKGYVCDMIPRKTLAYAAKMKKVKKMTGYQIKMGTGLGNYCSSKGMNPVYDGKMYECFYNPVDTNIIDCYALQSFFVEETGEQVTPGRFVFSLEAQRNKGSEERQKLVRETKSAFNKGVRKVSRALLNSALAENVSVLSPELNEQGKFQDTRKELAGYTDDLVKEKLADVSEQLQDKISAVEKAKSRVTVITDVKALIKKYR